MAIGAMGQVTPADLSSAAAETGVAAEELLGVGFILGVALVFGGIIDIVLGILGIRTANDNQKIMPVWWLSLIALILGVIGCIMGVAQGTITGNQIASTVWSIAISLFMFWIANNIKRQAGK